MAPPVLGYQGEKVDSAMSWTQWRRGYWREAQALLSSHRWKSRVREGS